jgi:four helix bundle protein
MGSTVTNYRELVVWQKSMELVVACYEMTRLFPRSEVFGLASQLQRAAVSVPSNIAEGSARQHTAELLQFLSVASGSLAELETHLLLAERLGFADSATVKELLSSAGEVGRMLQALKSSLRSRQNPAHDRPLATDH